MSDIIDELNKIFRKDLLPALFKYLQDSNNNITNDLNNFLNDPQLSLKDILKKFSKNKDNVYNKSNNTGIENIYDASPECDDEYHDLLERLILIEENMIKIENIIKNKKGKYEIS
tara:strand:- start:771 stop:1115 length:345 start_codon:yes stop_codon:yes gene_type:complete